MNTSVPVMPTSQGWEVPEFEAEIFATKRHEYALVITALNEGEPIRARLQCIRNANLEVDVIVADGGSTEDSLDEKVVRDIGVRAVLTKTGTGRLSALLRMAYAWCLRDGYAGIVTIDGNGKDGVETVTDMIARLREGYDYVQGSRYCRGGAAVKRPLEGTIGNRLIDAPVLSLASGYWFTDTTSSFRAYSRRYLLDERVAPFRAAFCDYELLFYLTARGPQLGYRVTEVPVCRANPVTVPVSTESVGWAGKIGVLRQLLAAAIGAYDVAPASPSSDKTNQPLPNAYLLTAVFALMFTSITLLYRGYTFPHVNHGQELPPILALLDPTLYLNDFAVQSFLEPTPRYLYQQVVVGLVSVTGIEVSSVLFFLNIVAHISFFAGVFALSKVLVTRFGLGDLLGPRHIFLVVALGLVSALSVFSWGGQVPILHSAAVPSTFAMAIAIWSPVFALSERWKVAYLLAGLAVMIQFLVGFHMGLTLFLGLLFWALSTRDFGGILLPVAFWLTPAVLIFLAMLLNAQPVPADFDFMETYGLYRVAHHWVPSWAGVEMWAADLLLAAGALVSAVLLWSARPKGIRGIITLTGMILTATFGVILNFVFVEILPIEYIGKLQFQRILPIAHVAAFALVFSAISRILFKKATTRLDLFLVVGLGASVILSIFGSFLFGPLTLEKAVFLLALLAGGGVVAIALHCLRISRVLSACGVASIAIALFVGCFSNLKYYTPDWLSRSLEARYRYGELDEPGDVSLAQWLKENTDRDEVILYPPFFHDFLDRIQLRSRRSAFFTHKNVPYTDHGVYEWAMRSEALLAAPLRPHLGNTERRELWRAHSSAAIENIARRNGICHIVDSAKYHAAYRGVLVHEQIISDELWQIWKLADCSL